MRKWYDVIVRFILILDTDYIYSETSNIQESTVKITSSIDKLLMENIHIDRILRNIDGKQT